MIPISQRLRNAARFGSPVAPDEREKAAKTIDKLVEALRGEIARHHHTDQWRVASVALLRDLGEEA